MKLLDKFIDEDINKLKLTNQEVKVYHYIIEHLENIGSITAKEIAEDCFCTTTTVNRFCKKYGISGFSDFSAIISYEQSQLEVPIDMTHEEEDVDMLKVINKDKPVFLFGSGASLFTASVMTRFLLRKGYIAILIEDRYFLKEIMHSQLMLFSNSGMTAPALDLAYTANKKKMNLISITARGSELDTISKHSVTFYNHIEKVSSEAHESQLKMHNAVIKLMK